ncbi:MAG: alpha/beta fold hydrolase [Pseudomonadota bacterium]
MSGIETAEKAMPKKRSKLKMFFYFVLLLIIGLAALYLFGPREPVETTLRFEPSQLTEDLDAYLANSDAADSDAQPHATKEIVWAYPTSKAKTPLSLVYVHGFSATKGETRPVPDMAAKALGANLFYTRLEGHGAGSEAMAKPTVQDWMDDTAEAIEIGSRIGEKVIVIGVSTGAPLAAVAALHPELKDKIAGYILISPNFKLQNPASPLLTLPYARSWIPLVAGAERSFETSNDLHAKFWTSTYPTTAVLPMAALVQHSRSLPYENIDKPALFIYSEDDTVVDNTVSKQFLDRWGGETQLHLVEGADDQYNHVIAGDALSPNITQEVADVITQWLKQF